MPRLLITGSNGFVGSALRRHLSDSPWGERVIPCEPAPDFDATLPDAVYDLVNSSRPDRELHLAARSIEAYLALFERGRAGEVYNVCSGHEYRLAATLRTMLDRAGVQADVLADPSRMRSVDQRRVYGDHGKLSAHTGWQPHVLIEETLDCLISHWKEELQS